MCIRDSRYGARVSAAAAERPKHRGTLVGLTNLGNTCFLNAPLQCRPPRHTYFRLYVCGSPRHVALTQSAPAHRSHARSHANQCAAAWSPLPQGYDPPARKRTSEPYASLFGRTAHTPVLKQAPRPRFSSRHEPRLGDEALRDLELPPAGGGWTDLCVPLHPDCGGTIRLRVRVSAWEDRPVDLRNVGETAAVPADFAPAPAAATLGFAHDMTASAYAARMSPPPADDGMEHTVLDTGCAALSYYNLPPKGDAALLWLPGRNDCFYHPHVAELLADHGIDLYVLSYRRMGAVSYTHLTLPTKA